MQIGFDAKRIFHNASGLGNYGRDLVSILSRYYPEHLYLLYNPGPAKVNRLRLQDNMQVRYPEGSFYKKFPAIWRRGPIVKQLQRDRVTLYHGLSNELPAGIRQTGIKTAVTIHDLIFLRYPQWYAAADRLIYTRKVKNAAADADAIIAISDQTRRDITELLGTPAEKIRVIYQGCHEAFRQDYEETEKKRVQEAFGLPPRFLLSVGTVEERKNLLTIVRSLPHHPLPLVVIGRSTSYAEKVRDFIQKGNLQHRVFFLKDVSMRELAIIYRLATVFCYPSVYEGFGIPIIEALFSSTPVITSKGGCFPEAGGPSSFYIDSFDERALAEKVHLLLGDRQLYNQVISEGLKFAQRFNDAAIAGDMMNLYNDLVSA